jgi:hypothetical protein
MMMNGETLSDLEFTIVARAIRFVRELLEHESITTVSDEILQAGIHDAVCLEEEECLSYMRRAAPIEVEFTEGTRAKLRRVVLAILRVSDG